MRWYHQIRRARIFTLVAVIVASSVSAFGESGQSRLSAAGQAALLSIGQQPGETVRQLSIDEAAKLALEQNLGIRIQQYDPQIQDLGVALARSSWAPNFTTNFSRNSQTQQPTSSLAGGATSILNGSVSSAVGLNQVLPWGANYTATWNSSRATTTNNFASYSPQLGSNLNLQFTQPLLRNFDIDQIRAQVANSR